MGRPIWVVFLIFLGLRCAPPSERSRAALEDSRPFGLLLRNVPEVSVPARLEPGIAVAGAIN